MAKISPFLWYIKEAEEAARLYVSIFPDSSIDHISTMDVESPAGPPGTVVVVEFRLFGQRFMAMSAGPLDHFNHAISFYVDCEDQAEIDRYWDALIADGGKAEECGWVRDRYGVAWQIIPRYLTEVMHGPDREKNKRVSQAMLTMTKLDLAKLKEIGGGA